jgi:hypothetical protein
MAEHGNENCLWIQRQEAFNHDINSYARNGNTKNGNIMTTDYFLSRKVSHSGLSDGGDSLASPQLSRANPLSSKVTSVLSASYADSDIRDALSLLDKRGLQNTAETRRQLRLDVQKEVIESNGDIIREFGRVAEV